jgi:hypothetical protein
MYSTRPAKARAIEPLPRPDDVFRKRAVTLDAHRLVELSGIRTIAAADEALFTVSVGRESNVGIGLPLSGHASAALQDHGRDLVAGHAGQTDHGVLAAVLGQIGSAVTDHFNLQEDLASARLAGGWPTISVMRGATMRNAFTNQPLLTADRWARWPSSRKSMAGGSPKADDEAADNLAPTRVRTSHRGRSR